MAESLIVTALSPTDLTARLLDRLRSNPIDIPSYPAIATKLQAMVGAGRSLEQLAAVAANDPPLVTALLARATSAAHAVSHRLDIGAAIQRVGVDELVQLAVAQSVGAIALAPGPLAALRRDTWRRSLVSGRVAQVLASGRGILPSEAYLAGLLQDFGSTAALSAIETLSKDATLPMLSAVNWRDLVLQVRRHFGEAISKRWTLPAELTSVIAETGSSPLSSFLGLVRRTVALLDDDRLTDSTELPEAEREAILAALPEVISQMALYTHTVVCDHSAPVDIPPRTTASWPCELDVVHRGARYTVRSISADGLEMTGKARLATNWLVAVTLQSRPDPVDMLLNVQRCDTRSDGTSTIVAKPFGLSSMVKQRWLSLLDAARAAATLETHEGIEPVRGHSSIG